MRTLLACVLLVIGTPLMRAVGTTILPWHTTSLVMGLDVSNGIVPPGLPSRVRVPPLERIVLTMPSTAAGDLQWTKDGKAIAGETSTTLIIPSASAADSGLYKVSGLPFPMITTGIALDVVPEGNVANVSSRLELAPGKTVQIVGFVVSGSAAKNLLFRVVGPTLKSFGVTAPAARPRVRCFDANGREVTFVHPAMVVDVNALFRSVGAFPLNTDELSVAAFDYGPFAPGAYTLHVSDAAEAGGTVLAEVFEMP